VIDDIPVAFAAAIPFPHGSFKKAWRGHRTVVLPDYQGLGIGVRISDFVAHHFATNGYRYFSKTAHPRMGLYRDRHPNWHPTSSNGKNQEQYIKYLDNVAKRGNNGIDEVRTSIKGLDQVRVRNAHRICYSHEYKLETKPEIIADIANLNPQK
jgi:hypothetical protein